MNSTRSGLSALLPAAGMEVCRLYAIISLLYYIMESPPYPFAALACVLLPGILVGRGFSFIAWRVITAVVVHAALCALCIFLVARHYSGFSFWLFAATTAFIWFRGAWIGSKGISHIMMVMHYDIGIAIFFLIYFVRMGIGVTDHHSLRIISTYFLFSILTLAASRSREKDKTFIASRSIWSILVPFISVFFIAAATLVLLYPILTTAAGEVYNILRKSSGSLLDILLAIIKFLFPPGTKVNSDLPHYLDIEATLPPSGKQLHAPGFLTRILFRILILIYALFMLVLMVIAIRSLVRYLAKKKDVPGGLGFFAGLKILCCFLRDTLRTALRMPGRAIAHLLASRRHAAGTGQEAFRKLCAWGKASGISRKRCETPCEYTCRLAACFPSLKETLPLFALALEEELYGRKTLAAADIARLKAATKGLSNAALIPRRLTNRFKIH